MQNGYMMARPGHGGTVTDQCPSDGRTSRYAKSLEACGYLRSPCRIWPAASNATAAAPGDTANVTIEPEQDFIGELVQMFTTNAEGFEISDIQVGTRNQVVNVGFVSHSALFAPDNQLNPVNLDPAGAGVTIRVVGISLAGAGAADLYVQIAGRTLS